MVDKPIPIPWRMYLLVLITGIFMISILGYGLYTGNRMNKVYAPLVHAAMEIKLQATLAHLWLEEIISDDHHEDINVVWEHQDQAEWYAKAMLEGGRSSEGIFIPLDDAEMRGKVKKVQEKLAEFKKITHKRLETKDISGIGTDIDQHYDNVFLNLLNEADEVDTRLRQVMTKDMQRFIHTQVTLIIALVLIFLTIGITYLFFNRQRAENLQSLYEANEDLKIEVLERKKSKKDLQASERKYRLLADNVSDVIWTRDMDLQTTYISPSITRLTGYSVEERLVLPIEEVLTPESLEISSKAFLEELALENMEQKELTRSRTLVLEQYRKDGSTFWAEQKTTFIRDQDGKPVQILGVMRDISERKQAEEKIKEYSENLESMVEERTTELNKALLDTEQAREGLLESELQLSIRNRIADIFLTSSDTDMYGDILDAILDIMASRYGFFGYINEDGDIVAPSMTKEVMDKCQMQDKDILFPRRDWSGMWGQTLLEKKTLYANKDLHLPEGHVPLTRGMTVPILYQAELIGILAVADKETDYDESDRQILETISAHIAPILQARLQKDIEERTRREAEKKLQESLADTEQARDSIDGILKSVADGLIVTDTYSRVVLMNRAAEDLLGVRFSEVLDRPIDFAIKEKALRDKFRETFDKKTTGYQFDFELPSDDSQHPKIMRARTSVVFDRESKETGIVMIIHDVTHEREVDRMKTEFISTAAHELRTPLTSIQGFSEILLMREDLSPDEKKKFLTYINKQSVGLAGIINDLLDISRIESGRSFELNKVPCNAGDAIRGAIPYFQEHYKEHKFEVILPEEPVELHADKEKMGQVLKNLLSNAAKYSPEGGLIKVIGEVLTDHYQISIEDQGIGMTSEQVEKVFDKFYRGDASDSAIDGTGLGMTVVKYIVEAHGGKVWVESELGKGTTVRFTIPI